MKKANLDDKRVAVGVKRTAGQFVTRPFRPFSSPLLERPMRIRQAKSVLAGIPIPVGILIFAILAAVQICAQEVEPLQTLDADEQESAELESEQGGELFENVKAELENGEIRKASALIDEAVEATEEEIDSADVHRSRRLVAAAFIRINNQRQAWDELDKLLSFELETLADSVSKNQIGSTLTALYKIAGPIRRGAETMAVCETAIAALEPGVADGLASAELDEMCKVRIIKARLLADRGDQDEARQLLESEYETLSELYQSAPQDELAAAMLLRAISNVMAISIDEERRVQLFEQHQTILAEKMESAPDNISYVVQYIAAIRFRLRGELTTDPLKAQERLIQAREVVKRVVEANPSAERALAQYMAALEKLDVLVKGQIRIRELVGTEILPLDVIGWVNGDPVTDEQRSGSVVLLDFWAIWNGPSLEALNRYKTLHDKYADQGLQIIGVTRYFNIDWDFERGAPRRSRQPVTPETENEALELFLEQKSVPWASMVIDSDQDLFTDFAVTGLPHAVLVDREGKIHSVKVGSSDAITESLDQAIQELLSDDD